MNKLVLEDVLILNFLSETFREHSDKIVYYRYTIL